MCHGEGEPPSYASSFRATAMSPCSLLSMFFVGFVRMNGDRINGLQLTDPHQWVKNLGVKEPTDPHLVAPLMEVVYQPTGWFTLPKTKGFSEK